MDVTDLGAAGATVAFFRSLGGAIGVSVLGAVLSTHVADLMATGLARLGIAATGGSTSLDLTSLPAPIAEVVRASYGDATARIFIITAIGFVATLFLPEKALRTTVRLEAETETPTPSAIKEFLDHVGIGAEFLDHGGVAGG